MEERILHQIWSKQLFIVPNLFTVSGKKVSILNSGVYNNNSGPDFFNAQVMIDGQKWAGNIEIHVNSSDWRKHNHSSDDAYENVVLHVVFNHDEETYRKSGEVIPTIELKRVIDEQVLNFADVIKKGSGIICSGQINDLEQGVMEHWLDKMLTHRLERKSLEIQNILDKNIYDWELTFREILARDFGLKVNSLPFQLLVKSIPKNAMEKHKDSLINIEAILFGQSGLLEIKVEDDEYLKRLQKEYKFYKSKFSLIPLPKHIWKFMRMRPVSFPTIRIAQFAQLIFNNSGLFSKIISSNSIKELRSIFSLGVSEYWKTHYVFGKETKERDKRLGKNTIDIIIINSVVTTTYLYAKIHDDENLKIKAVSWLRSLKSEKNSIIKEWQNCGVEANSSYSSQALIELKNEFCSQKKCLNCNIGLNLLYSNKVQV